MPTIQNDVLRELLEALKPFANLDKNTNSNLWLINKKYCDRAREVIAKAESMF